MKLPSSTAEEEEEVPEEQEQEPETEPEPIPEPVEELEPEPEPEANLDPILDLPPEADDTEPVLELKPETWAIKDSEEEAREEVRGEAEGCSDPKMAELCIQEGISTQQVKPVCSCVLLVKCSNMFQYVAISSSLFHQSVFLSGPISHKISSVCFDFLLFNLVYIILWSYIMFFCLLWWTVSITPSD